MLSCTAITNLDVKLKFDLGNNNNKWFIDSISTKSVFSSVVVLDLLESVAKCPVYFCHSVNHILYIHQDLKVRIWGFEANWKALKLMQLFALRFKLSHNFIFDSFFHVLPIFLSSGSES